ncbi:MAG: hypothetical protein ACOVQE_08315 [Chitinophagaceae bacterium]
MKRLIILSLLFVGFTGAIAQETNLLPDQNPNYLVSKNKYLAMADSLKANQNTTVQETYKAFDWYQAKMDRRQQRFESRRQIRLANAQANRNFFNNGWGFDTWRNPWRFQNTLPSIGFRSGNWWFWF